MKKLVFLATDAASDPTTIDYRILGLHKNEVFDSKGDLVLIEYYTGYDGDTDTFSGLAVREERVYTRDTTTGLLTKRETSINWYDSTGTIGTSRNQINKYYTAVKGFESNKKARQNLLNNASMYLLSQVGIDNAKAFWKTLGPDDVNDYKNIGDLNIVTSISNSVEPYMTPTIKATLDTILNVTY